MKLRTTLYLGQSGYSSSYTAARRKYFVAPEKVIRGLFQGVAAQKRAKNFDFPGFLLARIGLTANGGASMRRTIDQKNAIKCRFLIEIISRFKPLYF